MQTPRILVTRPEPGATRTAQRLRAAGFEPVVLPLTRIERLAFEMPEGAFGGLVLTSAQALAGTDVAAFTSLPVVAVGDTTAHAAREAGFQRIETATGSAESVAILAASVFRPNSRIFYVCGRVRRPELELLLKKAGFSVVAVETYDAKPVAYQSGDLVEILGNQPFDAVILMSAVTAELFADYSLKPQLQNALLVCFSQRIADVAESLGSRIAVTQEANEVSLMALLETHFSK